MYFISLVVAFFACVVGKLCGMGGGVIIKPVLDACSIASVSAINFMSGCTVIGMSSWSVFKSFAQKDSQIDLKISTPLALGAAIGGILGNQIFIAVAKLCKYTNTAGGVQACLLLLATAATLIYTVYKDRIRMHQISSRVLCILIGFSLGMLGAFLGIGGGPFNMAALYFFFSMETKIAAQNSLYIILISQISSLIKTIISGNVPDIKLFLLLGMILCGVIGSELGGRLSKHLSEKRTTVLFEGAMLLVMGISVYNIVCFLF